MEHASAAHTTPIGTAETATVKQWLEVAVATLLVAGCPVAAVWWLRESGTVTSAPLAAMLGLALSLLASSVGTEVWERMPGSEDLVFSELMLWGYVYRRHTQRRLARTLEALTAPRPAGAALSELDANARAKLLRGLVTRMESRDPYLHGHSRRVAHHSWMIARRMGLPAEEVTRIRTAAALHDVGKVHTPIAILHKAGRLSDREYEQIKLHPGDGAGMVAALGDAELTAMVRHHHERLDGSGYPSGLAGDSIPLGARIIAVADTFDAITSTRPYRAASPHRRALSILHEEAGTRLDGDVVRAFCSHYAGRGPLALWSFAAALPERIVSWLLGSFASVASVAKVAAVAALVGGAAVGSSNLARQVFGGGTRPAAAHRTAVARPLATGRAAASRPSGGRVSSAAVPRRPAATRGGGKRSRHPAAAPAGTGVRPTAVAPATGALAPAAAPQVSSSGSGSSGGASSGGGSSGGSHHGGGEGSSGGGSGGSGSTGEGSGAAGGEKPPGTGEGAGKGTEGTPGKGGGETSTGRSEEARAKEEAPHGRSEETHTGNSEEAGAKAEEPHGKQGEPHGRPAEAGSGRGEAGSPGKA
jgi:hypothetical protein